MKLNNVHMYNFLKFTIVLLLQLLLNCNSQIQQNSQLRTSLGQHLFSGFYTSLQVSQQNQQTLNMFFTSCEIINYESKQMSQFKNIQLNFKKFQQTTQIYFQLRLNYKQAQAQQKLQIRRISLKQEMINSSKSGIQQKSQIQVIRNQFKQVTMIFDSWIELLRIFQLKKSVLFNIMSFADKTIRNQINNKNNFEHHQDKENGQILFQESNIQQKNEKLKFSLGQKKNIQYYLLKKKLKKLKILSSDEIQVLLKSIAKSKLNETQQIMQEQIIKKLKTDSQISSVFKIITKNQKNQQKKLEALKKNKLKKEKSFNFTKSPLKYQKIKSSPTKKQINKQKKNPSIGSLKKIKSKTLKPNVKIVKEKYTSKSNQKILYTKKKPLNINKPNFNILKKQPNFLKTIKSIPYKYKPQANVASPLKLKTNKKLNIDSVKIIPGQRYYQKKQYLSPNKIKSTLSVNKSRSYEIKDKKKPVFNFNSYKDKVKLGQKVKPLLTIKKSKPLITVKKTKPSIAIKNKPNFTINKQKIYLRTDKTKQIFNTYKAKTAFNVSSAKAFVKSSKTKLNTKLIKAKSSWNTQKNTVNLKVNKEKYNQYKSKLGLNTIKPKFKINSNKQNFNLNSNKQKFNFNTNKPQSDLKIIKTKSKFVVNKIQSKTNIYKPKSVIKVSNMKPILSPTIKIQKTPIFLKSKISSIVQKAKYNKPIVSRLNDRKVISSIKKGFIPTKNNIPVIKKSPIISNFKKTQGLKLKQKTAYGFVKSQYFKKVQGQNIIKNISNIVKSKKYTTSKFVPKLKIQKSKVESMSKSAILKNSGKFNRIPVVNKQEYKKSYSTSFTKKINKKPIYSIEKTNPEQKKQFFSSLSKGNKIPVFKKQENKKPNFTSRLIKKPLPTIKKINSEQKKILFSRSQNFNKKPVFKKQEYKKQIPAIVKTNPEQKKFLFSSISSINRKLILKKQEYQKPNSANLLNKVTKKSIPAIVKKDSEQKNPPFNGHSNINKKPFVKKQEYKMSNSTNFLNKVTKKSIPAIVKKDSEQKNPPFNGHSNINKKPFVKKQEYKKPNSANLLNKVTKKSIPAMIKKDSEQKKNTVKNHLDFNKDQIISSKKNLYSKIKGFDNTRNFYEQNIKLKQQDLKKKSEGFIKNGTKPSTIKYQKIKPKVINSVNSKSLNNSINFKPFLNNKATKVIPKFIPHKLDAQQNQKIYPKQMITKTKNKMNYNNKPIQNVKKTSILQQKQIQKKYANSINSLPQYFNHSQNFQQLTNKQPQNMTILNNFAFADNFIRFMHFLNSSDWKLVMTGQKQLFLYQPSINSSFYQQKLSFQFQQMLAFVYDISFQTQIDENQIKFNFTQTQQNDQILNWYNQISKQTDLQLNLKLKQELTSQQSSVLPQNKQFKNQKHVYSSPSKPGSQHKFQQKKFINVQKKKIPNPKPIVANTFQNKFDKPSPINYKRNNLQKPNSKQVNLSSSSLKTSKQAKRPVSTYESQKPIFKKNNFQNRRGGYQPIPKIIK